MRNGIFGNKNLTNSILVMYVTSWCQLLVMSFSKLFLTSRDVLLQITLYFTLPEKVNDAAVEGSDHSPQEMTPVTAGNEANHVNQVLIAAVPLLSYVTRV